MGLILKDKIKKLTKGYPTRTAKEQVEGGVLGGTVNLLPGEVVLFGAQPGEFVAPTIFDATKIAGIALATNVKLVTEYPGKSLDAPFVPGEAINLMISGYIAVKAGSFTGTDKATIEANVKTAFTTGNYKEGTGATTADGKLFTNGTLEGFNAFYTGVYEIVGYTSETVETVTTYTANVLAEIKYNM